MELAVRDRLLNEAVKFLWEHESDKLRVSEISDLTGVAVSGIYGHFQSRSGLIDEAYSKIQNEIYDWIENRWTPLLTGISKTSDALAHLTSLTLDLEDAALMERQRAMQLRITANAVSRRSFRKTWNANQNAHIARMSELFHGLRNAGELSEDFTNEQIAWLLNLFFTIRALHDLSEDHSFSDQEFVLTSLRLMSRLSKRG